LKFQMLSRCPRQWTLRWMAGARSGPVGLCGGH